MRWLQHFMFGGTLPVLTDDSKQAAEARANHRLSSEKQQLQGAHKVIYDAVGELSPGLSEEAFSTLCEDARALELNQITLNFCNSGMYISNAQTCGLQWCTPSHATLLTAVHLCSCGS